MELPFWKTQAILEKTPKTLIFTALIIVLLSVVSLCNPLLGRTLLNFSTRSAFEPAEGGSSETNGTNCDIFTGEWVPNPEAPYYTNRTCDAIHDHQNCMKYGRPDTGFTKWRWKPERCELPLFDPLRFLDTVRNKSMAFVGDSVGRNHMQSLICLLSKVGTPVDVSYSPDEYFKRWHYTSHNFTLASFWTPFLVKSKQSDSDGPTHTGLFTLYLDDPDPEWTTEISDFDYLILSAGHWFFRPSIYIRRRRVAGCRYCLLPNVTDLPIQFGYRNAFRTALRAINSESGFNGVLFLRALAPSHFEGGLWNKGGNCLRTRPFKANEVTLGGVDWELYRAQVEEFWAAAEEGKRRSITYRLMDTTRPMLMRPDGHPSRYGHWPSENVTLYNDCVHWCLPGPIDAWNDFLLELLTREQRQR